MSPHLLSKTSCTNYVKQLLAAFYPETKGKTLEEMDHIFGKPRSSLEGSESRSHDQDDHVADEEIVHQGKQ